MIADIGVGCSLAFGGEFTETSLGRTGAFWCKAARAATLEIPEASESG
jgi:hypothetical protein